MKIQILVLAMLLAAVSPVFAIGEMNVTATSLAPVFTNTNTSLTALNLTFNVTANGASVGMVNITAILVNISSATAGDVSFVELRNSTGATLGINYTVSTGTGFLVNITGGFEVTSTANKSMTVVLNISRSATRQLNISVNITASGIYTNETGSNITFFKSVSETPNSGVSNGVQIQDLHINVSSISPKFVDTGIENQTFVYAFNVSGTDAISNITLNLPSGYTLINISAVEVGGSNLSQLYFTNTTLANQLNITFSPATSGPNVKIYFTTNTSSTASGSSLFNLTVTGSNMTNIAPESQVVNSTNVTRQQLMNIDSVSLIKSVAILNGTDYWEFNFTINYTATVSTGGLIQFKLTNWTDASGNNLSLTNVAAAGSSAVCSVTNCATMRNEGNFSTTNKFNLTNTYESLTKGISVASTTAYTSLYQLTLRMVLPTGTPISSTWQATYGILFRSSP